MDNIQIKRCFDCGEVLDESGGLDIYLNGRNICSDCVEEHEMAYKEMVEEISEMVAEGEERSLFCERMVRDKILIG